MKRSVQPRRITLFPLMICLAGAGTLPICAEEGTGLWSLQPLPKPQPYSSLDSSVSIQPIDRYVGRRLSSRELSPANRAPAHRQVRRLSLLLTGLPPDPVDVKRFVDDPTDDNYASVVDRYLESPHFGERWARHWMDVVRFAETYGYEWNFLVRGAWQYRDYLIRAFNQDLPYDQLIREHVAGDLLAEPRINDSLGINESVIGTAFYRFGETGHDDCTIYPDISLDVMDNQIDTTFKAFQALTVSCARCHDHKLDAIPQRDYYAQLGIMASSRQVIHTLNLPDHQAEIKQEMLRIKRQLRDELARLWLETASQLSSREVAAAEVFLEELVSKQDADERVPLDSIEHPLYLWRKMATLEAGDAWQQQWQAVCHQLRQEHDRRTSFNRRFTVLADFSKPVNSEWAIAGMAAEHAFAADGDFAVLYDGETVLERLLPAGLYSHLLSEKLNATLRTPLLPKDKKYVSYQVIGEHNSACRTIIDNCQLAFFHTKWFDQEDLSWIRSNIVDIAKHRVYLEWTTLFDNQGYPNLTTPDAEYRESLDNPRSYFGITKVVQHDDASAPLPELDAQLLLADAPVDGRVELAERYREIVHSAVRSWSRDEASEADVFWINFFLQTETLDRGAEASGRLGELVGDYRALETRLEFPQLVVGMADQGAGFNMPVFNGGDPHSPADLAPRAYLSCLASVAAPSKDFRGSGREVIAQHIAHPDNPLTARVMVNRIWHHLFGTGLVKSVDNFGAIGDEPSHPELLDYLARRFVDSGWSIKSLIREIVCSESFRQSSTADHTALEIDPENVLLHHFPARRLEAEVIRDSILSVSGSIDLTMFGPSINPRRSEEVESRRLFSGPLDGAGRRSLYLKVTRMGPSQLLALFNLPDPGMTLGRRDSTNVPAQALGLLNHPFVHQQAQRHAAQLLQETNCDFAERVHHLFWTIFGRSPTPTELIHCDALFVELGELHGSPTEQQVGDARVWKEFIHALYNLKEFTYVL